MSICSSTCQHLQPPKHSSPFPNTLTFILSGRHFLPNKDLNNAASLYDHDLFFTNDFALFFNSALVFSPFLINCNTYSHLTWHVLYPLQNTVVSFYDPDLYFTGLKYFDNIW